MLISFVVAGFGSTSVTVIVVAVVLLDIAIQGQNILVQTRMFMSTRPLAAHQHRIRHQQLHLRSHRLRTGIRALGVGGWTAVPPPVRSCRASPSPSGSSGVTADSCSRRTRRRSTSRELTTVTVISSRTGVLP